MASQDSTTNDELLEYLSDRMFQIPVKSFMDENCLIFDPSIEVSPDHLAVFAAYQKLVKDLLEDFCQSKRVSFRQIHDSITKLYREPDLREFFGASFEQVLSSGDFDFFSQAMIAHNIVIQEQVLRMILASTGFIPDSLLTTRTIQSDDEKERQAQEARSKPPSQSKFTRDEFSEKKKKGGETDFELKREKEIETQRKLLEEEMRLLALVSASTVKAPESGPPVQPTAKSTGKSSTAESKPSSTEVRSQAIESPASRKSPSSQMSSAEAAQKWMKEAHQERANHPEDIHSTADNKWSHSPSDMTQRQQFLREQRDKILAMRREAREKQLSIDVEPKMTSRDAVKNQKPVTSSPASTDHEKMLAKRRALAAKLRQEVVDK